MEKFSDRALLTDLYEITMLQAYYQHRSRNHYYAAGLDRADPPEVPDTPAGKG